MTIDRLQKIQYAMTNTGLTLSMSSNLARRLSRTSPDTLVWERTKKVDVNHDLVRDLDLVAVAVPGADVIDQTRLEHPTGRHRRG